MTTDEKMIIKTLDYALMFYWIYGKSNLETKIYKKKQLKFYNAFINKDCGESLLKLVDNSITVLTHAPWEFPKGRKNYNMESDIECAVREFEEETNIKKSKYILLPDLVRNQSYISNNTQYINKYFVAFIKDESYNPCMDLHCNSMVCEVKNIDFMPITEIKLLKGNFKLLSSLAGPVFKQVKKWYKK
jgi:ADP-ribose pyrophosphatase YjhB (NUDIX family)